MQNDETQNELYNRLYKMQKELDATRAHHLKTLNRLANAYKQGRDLTAQLATAQAEVARHNAREERNTL